jgi:Spy/CpxP family protein refolding chaperone
MAGMNFHRVFKNLDAVLFIMSTSSSPCSAAALFLAAGVGQRVTKEFSQMKKVLIHAVLAFVVALGGASVYAQEPSGQQGGGVGGGMHGQPPSADQRLQHMTQQLNLTSEQQQQIKPLLESESQQMQSLHQDGSLSPQDRMAKMQQIRQSTNSQIKPILNSDQQTKFEQMMNRQEHHGGYGHGQGTPPDQQNPQQ